MKTVLSILCLIIMTACSKDDAAKVNEFNAEIFPQKWKLVKMTGNMANSEATGAAMSWQETYVLKSDKTFIKSRVRDGVTTEASGTYEFANQNSENMLTLNYDTATELIGSCMAGLQETMIIRSTSTMSGTWLACDGPGLDYERIE